MNSYKIVSNRKRDDNNERRRLLLESLEAGRKALADVNNVAKTPNLSKRANKGSICGYCKMAFTEETNIVGQDGSWPCSYHPGTQRTSSSMAVRLRQLTSFTRISARRLREGIPLELLQRATEEVRQRRSIECFRTWMQGYTS